ncbi:MAG: hypothetical protein INH41_19525 [Myxococcaceae bacterium]|jgi:hypothetical protein|nr:hypothetical protein [Myxococcaceae bacterium]
MEVRWCASITPGGFMLVGVPEDLFPRSIQLDSFSDLMDFLWVTGGAARA